MTNIKVVRLSCLIVFFRQCVNAYYACYLYGLATSDNDLSQFASVLLTTEINSVQTYWHNQDVNVYDGIFVARRMTGNVGGLDATSSTWFGSELEFVHGINM
jgi:endoglucanase Acf2